MTETGRDLTRKLAPLPGVLLRLFLVFLIGPFLLILGFVFWTDVYPKYRAEMAAKHAVCRQADNREECFVNLIPTRLPE